MADSGLDLDPYLTTLNRLILERPLAVVAAFLIVTVALSGGLGMITMVEDEDEAFTEDIDEFQALEAINDEFGSPFDEADTQTTVIQTSDNVLAQRELVRGLTAAERVEDRTELRVDSTGGPAAIIAQTIDPSAETTEAQRRTIERASQTEIRTAVRENSDNPAFTATLSDDFNAQSATASASISAYSHSFPSDGDTVDNVQAVQLGVQAVTSEVDGEFRVFGDGIINAETANVIGDSLGIVMPAVLGLILLFLIIAYRDPFDLTLGLLSLLLTIVWTFGFVGYAGIPFDQQMISVPILLIAVGIDFGIHIINRYREERAKGFDALAAMSTANAQLAVAFAIVTVTTVFGFGANVTSDLEPTRNFGVAASVGIIFTFLIFGIFLPAAKILTDRFRERLGIPEFGTKPIATEESALGRLLPKAATISKKAPVVFILIILVVSAGAAGYGQDVDRSFDQEDFLPPEELPAYITELPEPFAPNEYTVTSTFNFLDDNFEVSANDQITMYIQGPFERDESLNSVHRTTQDPPDSYATVDGQAETTSIITVIQDHADRDPEFEALVDRNDRSGNGVPDRNLDRIYTELESSAAAGQADQYLTDDRRALRVVFDVESDATQSELRADSREYAEEFRFDATPTGFAIIFEAVTDVIFESAIFSLTLAVGLTAVFLVIVYWLLERQPLLGLVNVFPILVTVSLLIATMRALGLSLNAITATILSITIGVGIAYSVHITARFIDEYVENPDPEQNLIVTLRGTGGALTGSMLTTSIGTGALVLAISPILGEFGLLMAISVFYSYLTAIVVLPPTIYLWARYDQGGLSIRRRLFGGPNLPTTDPADD